MFYIFHVFLQSLIQQPLTYLWLYYTKCNNNNWVLRKHPRTSSDSELDALPSLGRKDTLFMSLDKHFDPSNSLRHLCLLDVLFGKDYGFRKTNMNQPRTKTLMGATPGRQWIETTTHRVTGNFLFFREEDKVIDFRMKRYGSCFWLVTHVNTVPTQSPSATFS